MSIDEVKNIRDKAEAMRLYAKQAKDIELETTCAEIKLRATRRIGEISKTLETSPGQRTDKPLPASGKKLKSHTLKSAGISTSAANVPAKFKPEEAAKRDAMAKVVIEYAKKIKDWPMLEAAVAEQMEDQAELVRWWEEEVQRPGGDRK